MGPDGSLLYASDRGGWWELHRLPPGGTDAVPLCPGREEEFGGPLWRIGLTWFTPWTADSSPSSTAAAPTPSASSTPRLGELVDAAGPWTAWEATLAAHGSRVVGVAASPRSAYEVVELDTGTGRARVIGSPHEDPVDPAYYPEPQIRTFTGPDNREVHAHIYPPHNPDRVADDELPPYVVWVHGGPTSHARWSST